MSSFYSPANVIPVDLAGLSMQNLGESIQALINQTGKSKYLDDVLNPLLRILMAYQQNFDLLLTGISQINSAIPDSTTPIEDDRVTVKGVIVTF